MTIGTSGYVLRSGDGRSRWFLDTTMVVKADGEATGGGFTLLECTAPEGFAPPLHVHHREDECFYLLDGKLTVHCGDDSWVVDGGGFVFLPRGVPHAFVVSRGPVKMLQITSPSGFEAFVEALGRKAEHDGLPAPDAPDAAVLAEVPSRHGYEIVGPPPAAAPTAPEDGWPTSSYDGDRWYRPAGPTAARPGSGPPRREPGPAPRGSSTPAPPPDPGPGDRSAGPR